MSDPMDPPSSLFSITAPELLRAVTAATGDQGAASRHLRAVCKQLRIALPATFSEPLVITLPGCTTAETSPLASSCDSASTSAANATACNKPDRGQSSSSPVSAANAATQQNSRAHCNWPLLHIWQKQKLQKGPGTMQLPAVHLQLGPGLVWHPPDSSSNDLVQLLLPDCERLKEQGILQGTTALTVTYTHEAVDTESSSSGGGGGSAAPSGIAGSSSSSSSAAQPALAGPGGSSSSTKQPRVAEGVSSSSTAPPVLAGTTSSSSIGTCPASVFASCMFPSCSNMTSFTLQAKGGAFWVQLPSNHSNTGSSNSNSSIVERPCHNVCSVTAPDLLDLMGASLLGRAWLTHLLQLQQLKRLVLPVAVQVSGTAGDKQYSILHPDLAAASGSSGSNSSNNVITSSLQDLHLLLVPVVTAANNKKSSKYVDMCNITALQQLLEPLLLHCQLLRRLNVTVLCNEVVQAGDLAVQLGQKFSRQCRILQSFTLNIMGCDEGSMQLLHFNSATWNCRSSCVSSLYNNRRLWPSWQHQQQQKQEIKQLQQLLQTVTSCQQHFGCAHLLLSSIPPRKGSAAVAAASAWLQHLQQQRCNSWPKQCISIEQQQQLVQLRQLGLWLAGQPTVLPVLPSSCLQHVTHLQLVVPQTLLPQLTWLLPDQAPSDPAAPLSDVSTSSSSEVPLWSQLRILELSLDWGDNLEPAFGQLWEPSTYGQQQDAVRLLLSSSSKLEVVKIEGSRTAGVTLIPDIRSLADTAAGTLKELQLVHTLPNIPEQFPFVSTVPYLAKFTCLQKLCLARTATMMSALELLGLPPSLHELHLEGFNITLALHQAVQQSDTSGSTPLDGACDLFRQLGQTQQGSAIPLDQLPLADLQAMVHQLRYASLALQHARNPQATDAPVVLKPAVHNLRSLRLVNCYATRMISIEDLVAYAGFRLEELVLVKVRVQTDEQRFAHVDKTIAQQHYQNVTAARRIITTRSARNAMHGEVASPPCSLLPHLRKLVYVECNMPCMFGCGADVTDVTSFLQHNAPELQHLVLAAVVYMPVLDLHVQPILGLKQLRHLEMFVGQRVRDESIAFLRQQHHIQQQRSDLEQTSAIDRDQHDVTDLIEAYDGMEEHLLTAAQWADRFQGLLSNMYGGSTSNMMGPARKVHDLACRVVSSGAFGMSAAGEEQLMQELFKGKCESLILHRSWYDVINAIGQHAVCHTPAPSVMHY